MNPFARELSQHLDNIEFNIEIHDDEDEGEPKEAAVLTVKVEWEGMESEYQLAGSVD